MVQYAKNVLKVPLPPLKCATACDLCMSLAISKTSLKFKPSKISRYTVIYES